MGRDRFKEARYGRGKQAASGESVLVVLEPGDLRFGRAAAVIADADKAHGVLYPIRKVGQRLKDVLGAIRFAGGVGIGNAEGDDFRAVFLPLPPEQAGGQGHLVFLRAHHHVLRLAVLVHQTWQGGGVSERVYVVGRDGELAEAFLEVFLTQTDLLLQGKAAGQVAVGLYPPSADDLPASSLHERLDACEQFRVDGLDLVIHPRFASGENKFGVRVQAVTGAAAGSKGFVQSGGPWPEPDGIEVCIENEMDVSHSSCFVAFSDQSERGLLPNQ